ncbi:MAG: diadenylate cyclase CdaA [Turicibacter sp.]
MDGIKEWITQHLGLSLLSVNVTDIFEIIVIGVLLYYILSWIMRTKAWNLLKGVAVLLIFIILVNVFNLRTLKFLLSQLYSAGLVAVVVIFQPELRRALEQLGNNRIFTDLIPFDDNKDRGERFSKETIDGIVKATFELSRAKTGALIVIEQNILLNEYINTGIAMDALISSPLLVQIFEHNTPLHDGAVIVRGNRIIAATCYLPLSENMGISKALGTRHRAGLGISEATDSITIVVSEETGHVTLAVGGELIRNVDSDKLRSKLMFIQKKSYDVKRFRLWKGKQKKDEGKAD